jgi:cytidylate kinase
MFRIITVEREYGCGGGAIAAEIAKRLGWRLWDHDLTQEIANLAHVDCRTVEQHDERIDSPFYRLAKVFWRGSYERSMPLDEERAFDADCMVSMMEKIAARIAAEGNAVVVGRGAPYFLRERADAFHVFLYASRAEKIRRLVQTGKSSPEAEELVDTVDRERMTFIKHYFNADWPTRCLYHAMLNTAVGDEKIIAIIFDTMRLLEEKPALAEATLRGVR